MRYAGIIEMIDQYYNCTRHAGNTWIPLSQLGPDAIYVVTTEQEVRNLYRYPHINRPLAKIISLERLDENLLGMNGPLIFDHFAMMNLIHFFKEELKNKHGNEVYLLHKMANDARVDSRKSNAGSVFLQSQLSIETDKMTKLINALNAAEINAIRQEDGSWVIERPATEKDKHED